MSRRIGPWSTPWSTMVSASSDDGGGILGWWLRHPRPWRRHGRWVKPRPRGLAPRPSWPTTARSWEREGRWGRVGQSRPALYPVGASGDGSSSMNSSATGISTSSKGAARATSPGTATSTIMYPRPSPLALEHRERLVRRIHRPVVPDASLEVRGALDAPVEAGRRRREDLGDEIGRGRDDAPRVRRRGARVPVPAPADEVRPAADASQQHVDLLGDPPSAGRSSAVSAAPTVVGPELREHPALREPARGLLGLDFDRVVGDRKPLTLF